MDIIQCTQLMYKTLQPAVVTNIICIEELCFFNCILFCPHPVVLSVITGFISSAATLIITIIVYLVMQKRLRQKESAVVTASPANNQANVSESAVSEYLIPEMSSNVASASFENYDDACAITQLERIFEMQWNIAYASDRNYADTSEIAPGVYEVPKVENNVASASARNCADVFESTLREYEFPEVASNAASASAHNHADSFEIAQREEMLHVASNVVYASVNDSADASEMSPIEYEVPQVATNTA